MCYALCYVLYEGEALNENCFKENCKAIIQVTEHNFRPAELDVSWSVENILGETVATEDFDAYAKDPDNWVHNGNVHTLKPEFKVDGIYSVKTDYTDLAGNSDGEIMQFTVDHAEPQNVRIDYSTDNVFKKIIECLTFGFYKAPVTVTVSANDITSGVDYFLLSYTRDPKATDYHLESFVEKLQARSDATRGKDAFVATYELPLEARGQFSVVAVDRAGNRGTCEDKQNMIVTDLNDPHIQVSFAPKNQGTGVHFVDANVLDVDTFAQAAQAFYNGNVVTTITVTEENFFEGKVAGEFNEEILHEILLTVTRTDDDGNVSVTEYLCEGAQQKVPDANVQVISWDTKGDDHTLTLEFAEDGDYVINMRYIDFSENEAKFADGGITAQKEYTSKIITVDKTAPVMDVVYGNTQVVHEIDGRSYFGSAQSAVITVTEHNFRAADVAAAVLARNYLNGDVAVLDYAARLADSRNWMRSGNVYTAKIDYTVDANYTFDIDMVDLARNAIADYRPDLFTVDTAAPRNLNVSYSTGIQNQDKESYYNEPVTVTITAEDATSGIYHFAYSYVNAEGVSRVNAQLLDQAIQAAEIRYEGGKAIATFRIPRSALGSDNQFNGIVEFTSYDRCEWDTRLVDNTRLIVDNIVPTADVSYNAPVSEYNGTSYYDGSINGSIVINEANFDSADPVVTVTRNGAKYPVRVNWTNNSVDRHTGTFSLTEDGDYYVSVSYKDKSGNQMRDYKSNKLTVDTVKPTITASNIKANSANKDEKYGFVIEISDINLDPASMKPVLKAVKKNAQGLYESVEIDLGEPKTVTANQTYTYTVENLVDDALYTLTCQAGDRSANKLTQIVLEDGKAYDSVQFSINREGSTFSYGNEFTENLMNQYYVYSVNEDVVLVEINVDPIETYCVTVNGETLQEGKHYTTTQTSASGEWSKRTYVIHKDKFEDEGEYSIIVSSTDKASTAAFSDVKKLTTAFVVDRTEPVITITGLETGGRYQTQEQTVTLMPTDEGGRLNYLTVLVLDSNGNPLKNKETGEDISVRFDMSGEELRQYLLENDGKVTFTVPTSLYSQVKIICNDCAIREDNTTNEYQQLFQRVTVSENRFVILFSNTPVFVGLVGGLLALIAVVIVLISRSRKKNK